MTRKGLEGTGTPFSHAATGGISGRWGGLVRGRFLRVLGPGLVALIVCLAPTRLGVAAPGGSEAKRPPVAAPVALPGGAPGGRSARGAAASVLFAPAPAVVMGGAWVPQGPSPTLNGQAEGIPGPNPVVGAVRTIVAHPTNPNIVYVGATNGGIWRTMNATSATPTWTSLTDKFPSLSIGAMDLDPTDATGQTLVAGIGAFSS